MASGRAITICCHGCRGLERLDIVATENVLAAGYHERIHDALPGIEEERFGSPAPVPVLAVPEPTVATTRSHAGPSAAIVKKNWSMSRGH